MRFPLARLRALVACTACVVPLLLLQPALGARGRHGAARSATLESAVVTRIDELRSERGLRHLKVAPHLNRIASAHAFSMASGGFFGHASPNGTSALHRILSSLGVSKEGSWGAGEILASTPTPADVDDVMARWLESPVHERALLGPWTHLGVAAVRVPAAPGVFEGENVTLLVVDFVRRPEARSLGQ